METAAVAKEDLASLGPHQKINFPTSPYNQHTSRNHLSALSITVAAAT